MRIFEGERFTCRRVRSLAVISRLRFWPRGSWLTTSSGPMDHLRRSTLYEEKILDGRNRYLASQRAGVLLEPSHFVQFKGNRDEAAAFVISRNILRRHLTPDQRSAIAAELYAQLPKRGPGQPKKVLSPDSDNTFPGADDQKQKVASQMGTSVKMGERASAILKALGSLVLITAARATI